MARARLIWRTIATSASVARLAEICPELADFALALYMLLIVHADDFGREEGDGGSVKAKCHPRSPRPVADFERALEALEAVGLLQRYDAGGRNCFQIVKFEEHQRGLRKRTVSRFDAPPAVSRNFPEIPGKYGNFPEILPEEKRSTYETQDQNQNQRGARRSFAPVRRHLQRALHRQLDTDPTTPISELAALVKDLARPLGFTWNNPQEITALIEGVIAQRAKQRTG
jgi:hypothetical protein